MFIKLRNPNFYHSSDTFSVDLVCIRRGPSFHADMIILLLQETTLVLLLLKKLNIYGVVQVYVWIGMLMISGTHNDI